MESPKTRCSPSAAPTNSARSVAIAIASACSHSSTTTRNGSRSRQTSGRLRPVAMPSLALSDWIEHGHQVRRQHHPEQRVAELRAARHVGGEVARIDVGHRGDERGAQERQHRPDPAPFTGQGPLGRLDDAGFARKGVVADHHLPVEPVERDRVSHRRSANGRA